MFYFDKENLFRFSLLIKILVEKMLEIKPVEVIALCKNSNRFYKKGIILFIENRFITYKIHNVTDMSFENLQKRVYGL